MRTLRFVLFGVLGFSVLGCAPRPLPEDVSGYNTYDIVQKIRCEMRDAIKAKLKEVLNFFDVDEADRLIGMVENEDVPIHMLQDRLARYPRVLALYKSYAATEVTYTFNFDIAVDDDETGQLSAKDPWMRGAFSAILKMGKESQRRTERSFKISESFQTIFQKLKREKCDERTARIGNVFYPITGQIGLSEVVDTFTNLDYRTRTDESGREVLLKAAEAKATLTEYSDTITYETRIFTGLDPKIELSPVTQRLHVAEASLKLLADRKDIHKVAIGLTGPGSLQLDPYFARAAPTAETLRLKGLLDARRREERSADDRVLRELRELRP